MALRGALIPERSERREAFNIMLSMPAGTARWPCSNAAREFARAELADHRYVMVLHDHQANPHVHLSVRAEGKDGRRLNPRKADLRRWRETFAEKLRELGHRGRSVTSDHPWRQSPHRATVAAQGQGRRAPLRAARGEQTPVKLTPSRRHAAQAWCEIAKALASSDDVEDRELGRSIVNYARWLPGVRYKPPEQQPQRELPGVERGRQSPREPHTDLARTLPQRTAPERDRGR